MNRKTLLAALLAICVSACCRMQDDVMVKPLEEDKTFMASAAYSNMYTIDAGNLSVEKGDDSTVKIFGQLISGTHRTVQQELQDIADYFDFILPATHDSFHATQKELLGQLTRREFDSVFILSQIRNHHEMIEVYEKRISAGETGLVSRHAQKYLPMIRQHLEDAENIKRQIKISN